MSVPHDHRRRPRWISAAAVLATGFLLSPSLASAGKVRFERQELAVPGHILALDTGDLDGDGRTDLVVAYRRGLGPEAQRYLAVFFRGDRGFAERPELMFQAPPGAAMFDLGDPLPSPGAEVVYMTNFGVFAQSFAGRKPVGPINILRARTLVAGPEEEDLAHWDFLRPLAKGEAEQLIVPTRGSLDIYRREGVSWKRASKVETAQYSFYDTESGTFKPGRRGGSGGRPYSLRMTTVVPTLTFIDQDGDGRADLVTTYEDRIAVYPQRSDGTLSSTASVQRWLKFLTPEEQASRDSEMSLDIVDLNGDGIADVSATKIGGGISNLHSETRLYLGRRGGGFEAAPAQVFKDDGFATIVRYADLDGDGRLEMVHPHVTVSLFAMSQVFITGKFSLDLRLRRPSKEAGKVFEANPCQTLETVFGLDFSTGTGMRGMVPIYGRDFDKDGRLDLILSQGIETLELHRGIKGDELFDDDSSLSLTVPVSRETYSVPVGKEDGPADLVIAYMDHAKLVGRLTVLLDRAE